jgi:60 kDa SS-A/Ro ribonucleoprotein
MGLDAKLIVVGITATNFSIADPSDAGMLDVVGFDSAVPQIIGNFVAQDL